MGRFTIRDLRATVHLVNLWLGNFDAPFCFEVSKRNELCAIDRYAVNTDGERVGTARQCLKSGTPRDCSAACFKHFVYFASANCEKRKVNSCERERLS